MPRPCLQRGDRATTRADLTINDRDDQGQPRSFVLPGNTRGHVTRVWGDGYDVLFENFGELWVGAIELRETQEGETP